jgi:DNA-binding transcriptional ArsR family regulator
LEENRRDERHYGRESAVKIYIELTELEEVILGSLSRKSKTTEQVRYFLEGKGITLSSYTVSRTLRDLERMGMVTREKRSRTYRYKLASGSSGDIRLEQ